MVLKAFVLKGKTGSSDDNTVFPSNGTDIVQPLPLKFTIKVVVGNLIFEKVDQEKLRWIQQNYLLNENNII